MTGQVDVCRACERELPLDAFDTWLRDGVPYRRRQCRPCLNARRRALHASRQVARNDEQRAKQREYSRRWRESNRDKAVASQRLCKYGITQTEYDVLFAVQGGACAICRTTTATLQVDHEHVSGFVRGLLCGNCNKALGLLRDSPLLLATAAAYLKGVNR